MAGPDDWRIREAGAEDAAALALVGGATFLETFAGVLLGEAIVAHCARVHAAEAYRRDLEGGAKAWLAETANGAAPVGFALIGEPDLPTSRAGDVELKRIYLLSRFHGGGAGAALMHAAVQSASARGDRLLLGVYAGNARAIAFYRRRGFAPIARRKFEVGGTLYDDIVFAKPLHS